MLSDFLNAFNDCDILKNKQKIAVAVSGGIDSLSLILLANEWSKKYNIKVIGLTVDHKLRPTSTEEAIYIHNLLNNQYNIEHHILTWISDKPKSNIEAIARKARYDLLFDFCKNNNIDTLLLGHHLQDQVENFFIRLFRGSGIKGLSSMKKISNINNIYLIRPFLYFKKDDLKNYLIKNQIKWIEDESNNDEAFLRNKIRNFLNTFDNKELIFNRINNTIETIQTANDIIEEQITELENKIITYDNEYNFYTIKANDFNKLNEEFQYRLITKITTSISNLNTLPRFQQFKILVSKIKDFSNFKKYTFNLCIFEKISEDEFVCFKEYNSIKDKTNYLKPGEFNQYISFLRKTDILKCNKIKKFKGYKREILYTIPVEEYKKYRDSLTK